MNRLIKLKLLEKHQKRLLKTAERRRRTLLRNLDDQLAMAQALVEGKDFMRTRNVWRTNEKGERVLVERIKRMRRWYWINWSGVCFFQLWYGSKIIELKPGATIVQVATKKELPDVIRLIMEAVQMGELDAQIEDVAENGLAELRLKHKPLTVKETRLDQLRITRGHSNFS